MNAEQVAALRLLLAPTGWLERASAFARALRRSSRTPGGLLVLGTPELEPWHLAAHLDEESRLAGIPALTPTLGRWSPPVDSPPQLREGPARRTGDGAGAWVLSRRPQAAPAAPRDRAHGTRQAGARLPARLTRLLDPVSGPASPRPRPTAIRWPS